MTSSCGLSLESVSTLEILSTTSMPLVTRPNTVCLPSSHGAESAVTMKNCDAVRVRAGVRHRERAAVDLVVVELVLERVAGAAGAGAGRVAALDHEVRDHAVEDDAVVEPVARELDEVLHRLRRIVVEELELDRAVVGAAGCVSSIRECTVRLRPAMLPVPDDGRSAIVRFRARTILTVLGIVLAVAALLRCSGSRARF